MVLTVISALLPVFLVVMLGYIFRRTEFFPEDFWTQTGKLTYYVLLPLLFFKSIATAPLNEVSVLPALLAAIAAIAIVSIILLLLRKQITPNRAAFSSVFQSSIRFNNYIGTSVAALLFHKQGILYAAIFTAVLVPVVNILAVLILTRFGTKHEGMRWRHTLAKVAANPLIISCIAGVLVNVSRIPIPNIAMDMMDILSKGALPLGLLAVGAGMQEGFRFNRRITYGLIFKLLLLPSLTLGLCIIFGVRGLEAQIAVLMTCLPGATSSYVLARQLGGDAPLAAMLLSLQTAFAMITMPIMLSLAMLL
jgi:predicted permease